MMKKTKQLERVQTWAGALVQRSRACGVTVPDLATKALIDRGTIYHWMRTFLASPDGNNSRLRLRKSKPSFRCGHARNAGRDAVSGGRSDGERRPDDDAGG